MKIDDVALRAMIETREASGSQTAVLEALKELLALRRAARGVIENKPGSLRALETLILDAPPRPPDPFKIWKP